MDAGWLIPSRMPRVDDSHADDSRAAESSANTTCDDAGPSSVSVTDEVVATDHAHATEMTAYHVRTGDGRGVTFLDVGLAVTDVVVPDRHGVLANVVLAHPGPSEYWVNRAYLGATVGRVANRIAGAWLPTASGPRSLTTNEGRHHLHGGTGGLHGRRWTCLGRGVERDVDGVERTAWLRFSLRSPDGDEGYPGNVDVTAVVAFEAMQGGAVALSFAFEATTDAPTPLSLAHHGYWNLAGPGRATVDDHDLTVHADTFVPVGDEMIPTGEIAPVEGTPFDLRGGARLGERLRTGHPQIAIGRGFDHGFVVADPHADALPVREVAVLVEPLGGRRLTVHTDQPGVQVYAGGWFDGTMRDRHGRWIRQGDAVALEPQRLANAVHRPDVYGDVWLQPGERYVQRTRFVLDVHGAVGDPQVGA